MCTAEIKRRDKLEVCVAVLSEAAETFHSVAQKE